MNVTRRMLLVPILCIGAIAMTAPQAHGANTIADCVAGNQGVTDIVCHEVAKLPGTATKGQVKVSWQLVPGDMSVLQGGIWMQRAPIKGQRTGGPVNYPDPDSDTLCAESNGFSGCAVTYSGTEGSVTLDFPVSMAGYRYIIMGSEALSSATGDRAASDIRDNSDNTVVWVNKAFRFKDKGKMVVRRACPKELKGTCQPAVLLEVNTDVGYGMPARPNR